MNARDNKIEMQFQDSSCFSHIPWASGICDYIKENVCVHTDTSLN